MFRKNQTISGESWEKLPPILTSRELMKVLPLGRNTIYALLRSPDFPARRVGRKFVVSKRALQAWLEEDAAGADKEETL